LTRLTAFLTLLILPVMIHAAPIDDETREKVYKIGLENGVPVSVTRQLMHEESRGDAKAVSPLTSAGYSSKGLFQIYTKPDQLAWILWKFWKSEKVFDIENPIDNATVALAYLSSLHDRFGNWYEALLFYNHGNVIGCSKATKAYAIRIINAP
jgi:hypothetical protein